MRKTKTKFLYLHVWHGAGFLLKHPVLTLADQCSCSRKELVVSENLRVAPKAICHRCMTYPKAPPHHCVFLLI